MGSPHSPERSAPVAPASLAKGTVLVVDDEDLIRWSLRTQLAPLGYHVIEASSGAEALAHMADDPDVILLDFKLPDSDGFSLLRRLREMSPDVPVIVLTAFASVPRAVEAMRHGAYHYAKKPLEFEELTAVLEKALEMGALRRDARRRVANEAAPNALGRIVGTSPAMMRVKDVLARVAASPASTVLLTGETGTGKDLAAKAIHYNSERSQRPFVNITCSALPEHLLESELFGHERGAFTDARQQKKGLFESAAGGTVFLDEIGEMPPALQAKLLRFLEEKSFKRVGGLVDIRIDTRVIAATHRNLEDAVNHGTFREDLFYRLSVMPIELPPLRDRTGDVPLLAATFVEQFNVEFKKDVQGVSTAAMRALEHYDWPGNVRELRNAIERAMLLTDDAILGPEHFPFTAKRRPDGRLLELPSAGVDLEMLERDLVIQALERAKGNRTHAGTLLHLNRDQVRYRIEKYSLEEQWGLKERVTPAS